jgi:predicted Zn-dependent protease
MAQKSERRKRLEASLAEDPKDAFLRYGLALQCVRDGDTAEGIARLRELIRDEPTYIAAYHQLGQALMDSGDEVEARAALLEGQAVAERQEDWHAAQEMAGLLMSLS